MRELTAIPAKPIVSLLCLIILVDMAAGYPAFFLRLLLRRPRRPLKMLIRQHQVILVDILLYFLLGFYGKGCLKEKGSYDYFQNCHIRGNVKELIR
jgi:hypothetical protein